MINQESYGGYFKIISQHLNEVTGKLQYLQDSQSLG
jgi:hypothetical protein